ncbi:hypothetical protein OEA41_007951 [Lepraria neglecta]|uniref:Uncharacterized protein n=1 Tax=Lepraria neglecta TaxID=209136 RepID=A0AAD9ZDQ8_9LECA|nr:hypothetical protein OEA41_007951 [Lepraria neglecta]
MSPNSTPLHDGPQYRRYRASFPTEEEKEDVDIMIERFARPNYYTSEDFELSFACRMEKDELIRAQIRGKITLEESSEEYNKTNEEDDDSDQAPIEPFTGPAYQRFRATLSTEAEKVETHRLVAKERNFYSDEQIEQSFTTQWKADEDFRAAKSGEFSYREWGKRSRDEDKSSPKMMPINIIRTAIPWDEPEGTPLTSFDGENYQRFRATLATEDEKLARGEEADKLLDDHTERDVDSIYRQAWRKDQLFRAAKDGDISYEQFLEYDKPNDG